MTKQMVRFTAIANRIRRVPMASTTPNDTGASFKELERVKTVKASLLNRIRWSSCEVFDEL